MLEREVSSGAGWSGVSGSGSGRSGAERKSRTILGQVCDQTRTALIARDDVFRGNGFRTSFKRGLQALRGILNLEDFEGGRKG